MSGEILGRVHRHNFPLVDDDHPLAGHAHFRQDVGGKNHGVIPSQTLDQLSNLNDLSGIQSYGGLIQDEDLGLMDERLGQSHSLLVSLGKMLDQALALLLQSAARFDLQEARTDRGSIDALDAGHKSKIGIDSHRFVEGRILGQIAHSSLHLQRLLEDIKASHNCPSLRGGKESSQDAHGGSFPGPIGTQKAQHLALLDLEAHIFNGRVPPISLG